MINISDKSKCSGCKACSNACPVNAISFEYDEEGFWYPSVDLSRCVNCSKCEKVCPYNEMHKGVPECNRTYNIQFFAAQWKDKKGLYEVSSGGAFQAIAKTIIADGGVVYGAAQENVDKVFHVRATDAVELKRTQRSKYLQSDIGDCFTLAKQDLDLGYPVLFSGTGCQISGLNCFLGRHYDNLYTCEVICHGVPSQKVWNQYRKEKEKAEGKRIVDIVFRDKSIGWSKNQYKITYDDGTEEYERSVVHAFHAGYLQGFFYRPSCGTCPFASLPRVADISLADYWKYQGPMLANDAGVSLVAVNNEHGEELIIKAKQFLDMEGTSRELALDSCVHMDEHPTENPLRRPFIEMALNDSYYAAKNKYIHIRKMGPVARLKNKLRQFIKEN